MNAKAIQIGDHPAEDTFVSLHRRRDVVGRVEFNSLDHKPFTDTSGWHEPDLPVHMMNTGKPRVVNKPARNGGLKIYVAGPMTGIPQFNFPAFHAAAKLLRAHGHEVFNPAEKDMERHGGIDISLGNVDGSHAYAVANHGFSLREALRDDTHYICTEANAIAMLPNWEGSKGAIAEHALAFALGHLRIYLGGFYG